MVQLMPEPEAASRLDPLSLSPRRIAISRRPRPGRVELGIVVLLDRLPVAIEDDAPDVPQRCLHLGRNLSLRIVTGLTDHPVECHINEDAGHEPDAEGESARIGTCPEDSPGDP